MSLAERLPKKGHQNKKKDSPIKNIQAKVRRDLADQAQEVLDRRGYSMVEFIEASMEEVIAIEKLEAKKPA